MRVDRQLLGSAQLRSLTVRTASIWMRTWRNTWHQPAATRWPPWALDNRMCGAFLGASCCLFRSHLLGSCTRQVTNFLLIPFFAFFSCLAAVANLPGEARREEACTWTQVRTTAVASVWISKWLLLLGAALLCRLLPQTSWLCNATKGK